MINPDPSCVCTVATKAAGPPNTNAALIRLVVPVESARKGLGNGEQRHGVAFDAHTAIVSVRSPLNEPRFGGGSLLPDCRCQPRGSWCQLGSLQHTSQLNALQHHARPTTRRHHDAEGQAIRKASASKTHGQRRARAGTSTWIPSTGSEGSCMAAPRRESIVGHGEARTSL